MKFAMMDSRLSDLLQTSEHLPYIVAGFFFHDRGIMEQKSMSGMLQELLHSILLKSPALRQFVHPIYVVLVEVQKTRQPKWDIESLKVAFEAIITQREVITRLCLFLDALDEHHGDNEHLAGLMKKLVALADGDVVKLKLCLASRPWDTFVASFSKCPGFKIHDHTYNDIRAYTLAEFTQSTPGEFDCRSTKDPRSAELEALAVRVTEKAHGVFIWVRIVVEEVAKCLRARTPFFVLEEKLAKMPEELKDLYQHTLERIEPDHAEESYVMLQIALCAISPLRLETFVNVTTYTVWQKVPEVGEGSAEDMTQRVVSRSGGLLEVIESTPVDRSTASSSSHSDTVALDKKGGVNFGTVVEDTLKTTSEPKTVYGTRRVQFIHQTVKEYVQNQKNNFGLKRNRTGGSGFFYILAAAIRPFDEEWTADIGLDLFEYARFANLDKTLESQMELQNLLNELCTGYSTRNNRGELVRLSASIKYDQSSLDTRNKDGKRFANNPVSLEGTRVSWWLQRKQIDFYTTLFVEERSPIRQVEVLALAAGLFQYVEGRLKDIDPKDMTIFLYVAAIGPKITSIHASRRKMLDLLFEHGVPPDDIRSFPYHSGIRNALSPLALIIQAKDRFDQDDIERVSAIACLLDHGANPNMDMRGRRNRTFNNYFDGASLFIQCIGQESVEIVRLFGQYGATLPKEMIVPVRTLWQMLSTPSAVLKEVIRIMQLRYPDVDLDEKSIVTTPREDTGLIFPVGDIFWNDYPSAAAPTLGTITAISFGLSQVFAADYSAAAKLRKAVARTFKDPIRKISE
jgi:hypothetical protein